jgi:hypothetical protein
MGWIVRVQLKGGKSEVVSPQFESREEAEADVVNIRDTLGTAYKPDVTWMTAMGADILGAHIEEKRAPFIG